MVSYLLGISTFVRGSGARRLEVRAHCEEPLEKRHGNLHGALDRGGSTKQGRSLGAGLKKGLRPALECGLKLPLWLRLTSRFSCLSLRSVGVIHVYPTSS